MRSRLLLVASIATMAGLLGACSEGRIAASSGGAAPPAKPASRTAVQAANTPIGERFASAALDDRRLGAIRGGLNTSSGLVVNFSFQEATYVNHNLAQSVVVPTLTVSPGSNAASVASATASPGGAGTVAANALSSIGNTTRQVQVNSPALAGQSLVNSGVTSVVSSLGGGGVTNVITNTANNQLVQQVITANIGITGLSQTIQQSVASTVMSRVAAANSQFR